MTLRGIKGAGCLYASATMGGKGGWLKGYGGGGGWLRGGATSFMVPTHFDDAVQPGDSVVVKAVTTGICASGWDAELPKEGGQVVADGAPHPKGDGFSASVLHLPSSCGQQGGELCMLS